MSIIWIIPNDEQGTSQLVDINTNNTPQHIYLTMLCYKTLWSEYDILNNENSWPMITHGSIIWCFYVSNSDKQKDLYENLNLSLINAIALLLKIYTS